MAPRRAVPADGGPTDGEASTTPSTGRGAHGHGDACEEIKPNLVGDVRPVAVKNDFVDNVRGNH